MKVMVFGTFDGLHPGHRFFLAEAQKRGELTVIVARDENVKKIKSKLPRRKQNDRVKAIKQEFPSVEVRLGDLSNFLKPIEELKPDIILLGYDQQLPPGIIEASIPHRVERLQPFEPQKYKSSLLDGS